MCFMVKVCSNLCQFFYAYLFSFKYTGSSVWDVRKVKHYIQETKKTYCFLMVHTCVGESGVCVLAH
jgi:hypothetical protein